MIHAEGAQSQSENKDQLYTVIPKLESRLLETQFDASEELCALKVVWQLLVLFVKYYARDFPLVPLFGVDTSQLSASIAPLGYGTAQIITPQQSHRGRPLFARSLSAVAAKANESWDDAYAGAGQEVPLAPGFGLELLAPLAVSRGVSPPSVDLSPLLSAGEPVYAMRPSSIAGISVWIGDDAAGAGGVPLSEATGIALLLCGARHLGEVGGLEVMWFD